VDEGKTETFYLEEVQAAPGYYLSQHKWMIKVSHVGTEYTIDVTHMDGSPCVGWGDNEILIVNNTPILGQTTVSEEFDGDVIPENTLITVTVVGNGKNETKSLTRNNPTAVFENLLLGIYTITEDTVLADIVGNDLIPTKCSTSPSEVCRIKLLLRRIPTSL